MNNNKSKKSNPFCWRLRPLPAALLAMGLSTTAAFAETRVHNVVVDREAGMLYIAGEEFMAGMRGTEMPYVEINGQVLTVVESSDDLLTVELPEDLTDGEYQIFVSRVSVSGPSKSTPHTVSADKRTEYSLSLLPLGGGIEGPAGPEGPQGPEGPPGPQGPAGPAGPAGADSTVAGPAGADGAVGPAGPQGPIGPMGPQGPTGPQGDPGADGAPGTDGAAGLAGADGEDGADGNFINSFKGAAEFGDTPVTYSNGDIVTFQGSSWLCVADSLCVTVGPPTAPDWETIAAKGDQGVQGEIGATGEQGLQGIQGEIGPAGPQGETGPQGPQGVAGLDGAVGETGAQGEKGDTGATGEPGPTGPEGPQGPIGPQGPQGLAGSADAWSRIGNAGTVAGTNFIGTTDNVPFEVRVNNSRGLRIEPDGLGPNLIGGHPDNTVTPGVVRATIAGGGSGSGFSNRVTDVGGTVGGGAANQAGDAAGSTTDSGHATVSGGLSNTASGASSSVGGGYEVNASGHYSTAGGGYINTASGGASTLGGGYFIAASGHYSTVGGGFSNTASGNHSTVGGGDGNVASAQSAAVVGGEGNLASFSAAFVGAGLNNLASGRSSFVGGGDLNKAMSAGDVVVGGGSNVASGGGAAVLGGSENTASGDRATVSGGFKNTASGFNAYVAGGQSNTASGEFSAVGGGFGNTATGERSTVSGGSAHTAAGYASAAGGGFGNIAQGDYSFVVGRLAQNNDVNHDGVFLFADSSPAQFFSATANEFAVRASGGFRFRTSSNTATGCNLPAGSGTFACTSDKNAKSGFSLVDPQDVLAKVAQMPISTWVYKTEDSGARHMGPMAQDFHAAFGLGDSDKSIGHIDADGVALAAIQGLYQQLQEKDAEIAALKMENEQRDAQLAAKVSAELGAHLAELRAVKAEQTDLMEALRQQNRLLQVRVQQLEGEQRPAAAQARPVSSSGSY